MRKRPPMPGRLASSALAIGLLSRPGVGGALETSAISGPVEVRIELLPDAPIIGDPIEVRIEAVAEEGVEILMPAFGEALDRFRIIDFVPREYAEEDGRMVHSQRYTLRAPISGEHQLPSILIEFIDHRPNHPAAPDDLDAYEILTESIPFKIESLLPEEAGAELSPPMESLSLLDESKGVNKGLLAAVASLLLMAGAAFWIWRSRTDRVVARSAWEMARTELDALLAGPRPTAEKVDAYFVDLSGIVRRYLENRFAVRSPELTTERFLELVSDSPDLRDAHQALLRDFLLQCDLVKFAHHIPSPESIAQAIEAAERFIHETRDHLPGDAGANVDMSSGREVSAA